MTLFQRVGNHKGTKSQRKIMKLTTQRILDLQTSCLRAFVVILGFVVASTIVSAQESKPVGETTKPAAIPADPAKPTTTKPVADSKMPDISGKWTFKTPPLPIKELKKASVVLRQTYVVSRSEEAGIDFEFWESSQPKADASRVKWMPGTRRFKAIPKDEKDNAKGQVTLELSADGNTLSLRAVIDAAEKKRLAAEGGVTGEAMERFLNQDWRRAGPDEVAFDSPLKEPVTSPTLEEDLADRIQDLVGTWSRAESGTFSKLTIWPVENRESLIFVEGADVKGLLEWKPAALNFQGFITFNALGDGTVQATLRNGSNETQNLVVTPFEGQRKELLRSGFAKTERELDQKLRTLWTRVAAPAQPNPVPTVTVVKTEFKPAPVRDALRAKYREQPYRFYSNDTFQSVIAIAPEEAQEEIEVLIHKLDVKEDSFDDVASPNIAQAAPANQTQPRLPRPADMMPDISGRWRYTKYSEPGELLDGELQIRRTEGEPSILSAQRVPAFEPPQPAFLLKWHPDLRKFEIVPADPQAAKAAQELRLETFQVSADRQSIRQAVTPTEKGLEDARKFTNQQIADYYNLDGMVLTRLGAIEPEPNSTKPIAKVAETQTGRSMLGVGVAVPDTPAAKQLVEQLHAQESAAAAEAATIRQLQANGQAEQNKQPIAEHQRKLKNLLSPAFDLKLQLEELQVKELQSRLSRLERQIGQRKELREKIINRRAGELIEGDASRWDSTAPTSTKHSDSAVGNAKKGATPEVVAILRERLALLWDDLRNGNAKPEAGLRAINELAQAEPPEAHAQHVDRLQALLELVRGASHVSKAEALEIEAAYEAARSLQDSPSIKSNASEKSKADGAASKLDSLPSPEELRTQLESHAKRVAAAEARVRKLEATYFRDRSNAAELQKALEDLAQARADLRTHWKEVDHQVSGLELARMTTDAIADALHERLKAMTKLGAGGKATADEIQSATESYRQASATHIAATEKHLRYTEFFRAAESTVIQIDDYELESYSEAPTPPKPGYHPDVALAWLEAATDLKLEFIQFDELKLPFKAALRIRESNNLLRLTSGDLIVALYGQRFDSLDQAVVALKPSTRSHERFSHQPNTVLRGGLAGRPAKMPFSYKSWAIDYLKPGYANETDIRLEVRVRGEGTNTAETQYVTGTCVSPDGLVVIALAATSLVDGEPIVAFEPITGTARVVAADNKHGLTLLKLNFNSPEHPLLQWVKCRSGKPTTSQRLRLYNDQSTHDVDSAPPVVVSEVGQPYPKPLEGDDAFAVLTGLIAYEVDGKAVLPLKNGFAPLPKRGDRLMSVEDELQGLLLSSTTELTGDAPKKEERQRAVAIPAVHIQKLIDEYRSATKAQKREGHAVLRPSVEDTPLNAEEAAALILEQLGVKFGTPVDANGVPSKYHGGLPIVEVIQRHD